jgi:hypothetical protein
MRLRNTHPAFGGKAVIDVPREEVIEITWALENQWIKLVVDLSGPSATITGTSSGGQLKPIVIGNS